MMKNPAVFDFEVLSQHLTGVAGQVSLMNQLGPVQQNQQIANPAAQMTAFQNQMTAFQNQMTAFQNQMTAFQNQRTAFQIQMNNQFAGVNRRIDNLSTRLDNLSAKLDNLSTRLDASVHNANAKIANSYVKTQDARLTQLHHPRTNIPVPNFPGTPNALTDENAYTVAVLNQLLVDMGCAVPAGLNEIQLVNFVKGAIGLAAI